jgi:hypothetical protein
MSRKKFTFRTWWTKTSDTIKAALIGGVVTIIVALIPFVQYFAASFSEVKILEASPVVIDSRNALELVVWNQSNVAQAITKIKINFMQDSQLDIIGQTTYELEGTLDTNSGIISGNEQTNSNIGEAVNYGFSGGLSVADRGAWGLELVLPIREELSPNEHRSIIIIIPEKFSIRPTTDRQPRLMGTFINKYIDSNQSNEFALLDFLKDMGNMGISCELTYSEGVSRYNQTVDFSELPIIATSTP